MKILDRLIGSLRGCCHALPDLRQGGDTRYTMADIGMSAFSLFFMQSPSFLMHQRRLEEGQGRSNCQTLFGLNKIPSDNSVSAAPVRGVNGGVALAVTTFHDISERKAMEEALRGAKEEVDRTNQAKSRFLAAASHNLRQPLQSLLLFVSVLQGHVSGANGPECVLRRSRPLI